MSILKRLDHVDIVTRSLEKTVEFYEKLGQLVRSTEHEGRSAEILVGDVVFDIHEAKEGEVPRIDHISFMVEGGKEELELVRDQLVEKGIVCTKTVYIESTGRYLFNFNDLDGHKLQVNTVEFPIQK